MKTLKSYEEYKLNESSLMVEKYSKTIKDVLKDLGTQFYFIATFGTTIPVFIPFFASIVENSEFKNTLSEKDIVLLAICAFAIVFKENKSSIDKAMLVIREKSLGDYVKSFVDAIMDVKDLFSKISSQFGKVVSEIVGMFAYTALLIPAMAAINFAIKSYGLDFKQFHDLLNNPEGIAISTSIGVITITLRQIMNTVTRKMNKKLKGKELPSQDNEFVQKEEKE